MPRHRFDPVALVFGLVFVAAGAIVLAGGDLIDEGRALVPAGLIALGVAVLVHVGRRPRPSAPASIAAGPTPGVVGDKDIDALFAPVDHALADWDRAHAGGDTPRADGAATDTVSTEARDVYDTGIGATRDDDTQADDTEAVDPTEVDDTEADDEAVDPTEADDPTEGDDPTDADDPTEVDVTEVVDPTERYPRSEPE